MKSYFENISLSVNEEGDSLIFKVSANLNGEIKNVLKPESWFNAYYKGDRYFFIRYYIEIKEKRFIFNKNLLKDKIVRKAIIYWSRNPKIEDIYWETYERIWLTIVTEDKMFYLPKDLEEVYSKLLFLNKSYKIKKDNIEKGNHTVYTVIKAKWSNYTFIKKDLVKGKSNFVNIYLK